MRKVFLGEFQHSVDRQRRLAIPSEWRSGDDEPQVFYLMPGREHGVQVMPRDYFMEEVYDRLKTTSFADKNRTLAKIGRYGHECVCDRQGRINLSPLLVKHAQLELPEQVQLIGSVTGFEVRRLGEYADDIDLFLDEIESIQGSKAREE